MADQKTFPADFPEIASPSDDTWIVVYGKEAGSAATAAGGKIKVGSLPSGDGGVPDDGTVTAAKIRSEEHTSELQSLMRNSYAVFCLKKKNNQHTHTLLSYTTQTE